ncbi:hypothetical protein ACNPQM_34915 [Streptomyces sp. NPDC056231]|uniref:hypothetical protein n=1 Tax=Streptomyces sp. NPDC056231 TaxID=3345755 RepID=UPI003AB0F659
MENTETTGIADHIRSLTDAGHLLAAAAEQAGPGAPPALGRQLDPDAAASSLHIPRQTRSSFSSRATRGDSALRLR